MAKGREIFPVMLGRQTNKVVRKLYKNSDCDVCNDCLSEVRIFGDRILCKKCYLKEKK